MIISAFFICLNSAAQAPDPNQLALGLRPGTYYWTGEKWQVIEQINMSGGGMKHAGKMLVPGLTPQMVWTFRDARAPVQVVNATPLFCVRFIDALEGSPYIPSPRNLIMAIFDQKKDHRELQTTSGGNFVTFKAGLGKDHMAEIHAVQATPTTYLISPSEPLKPGEYILSGAVMGISGFDFGFHPAKP